MKLGTGQKGFTLIELLVVLSISAFITAAASMTVITMMRLAPRNSDYAITLRQVENAGHWISRDVEMSKGQITVDNSGTAGTQFLSMTVPQNPTDNITIFYQWDDQDMPEGQLRLIRNDPTAGEQAMVAQYISGASAGYSSDNCTLQLSISADSGSITVTRQYQALQRVPSQ